MIERIDLHQPTGACDGTAKPISLPSGRVVTARCSECERPLCACEYAYGHDCEETR